MRLGMDGFPLQARVDNTIILLGAGEYSVPLWARRLRVRGCGGGGGGGGASGNSQGADGGGSGFISEKVFDVVPGQIISYVCGPGGPGGNLVASGVTPGNNGSNGSDSTFGTQGSSVYLIARGGRSGRGGNNTAQSTGVGSRVGTNPGEEQSPGGANGVAGGPSPLTGIVANGSTTSTVPGESGEFGGGGGGGQSQANGSAGGTGGEGWIEVEALL